MDNLDYRDTHVTVKGRMCLAFMTPVYGKGSCMSRISDTRLVSVKGSKYSTLVNSLKYLFQLFNSLYALCQGFLSFHYALLRNDKIRQSDDNIQEISEQVSPKYQLYLAFL